MLRGLEARTWSLGWTLCSAKWRRMAGLFLPLLETSHGHSLYDRQVQQLQEQAQICMRGVSARSTPWSLIWKLPAKHQPAREHDHFDIAERIAGALRMLRMCSACQVRYFQASKARSQYVYRGTNLAGTTFQCFNFSASLQSEAGTRPASLLSLHKRPDGRWQVNCASDFEEMRGFLSSGTLLWSLPQERH